MQSFEQILQVSVDAASLGSLYALAALGVGLIYGIMRLLNFAHGDLITIGGYALIVPSGAALATAFIANWPTPFIIVAVLGIVAAAALLTEAAVFRSMRNTQPTVMLIGSFAVSFFIQNLIILVYTGRPKTVNLWPGLSASITILNVRIAAVELVTLPATAILVVALAWFMTRTTYGVEMRAASEDFQMARLLGVKANRVIALAFAISGALAGVVALLMVTRQGVLVYRLGTPIVMYAFVATIIGGMGSLLGAAVGGFLLGVISVLLQVLLPQGLAGSRDVFLFGLIIVLLFVRPQGLIPTRLSQERV